MHTVVLGQSEVTDLITEGLLFLMCTRASIMRFESSAILLDFPSYTRFLWWPTNSNLPLENVD